MNISLNLVNPHKSGIKYSLTKFSDSQRNLILNTSFGAKDEIIIISRMQWDDVQNIILAKKAIDKFPHGKVTLSIPYFLGARSDRDFSGTNTGVSYIPEVIAPIINSLNFDRVEMTDVHSNVSLACIKNSAHVSALPQVLTEAFNTIDVKNKIYIVSPDAGAAHRTQEVVDSLTGMFENSNLNWDYLFCSKHRNAATGKLTDTFVPIEDLKESTCIIIDDLIDGGRTFTNLAHELQKKNSGKVYLVAAHGIFSAGFANLAKFLDGVFTTNSYKDFMDIADDISSENFKFVQLNVY